MSTSQTPSRAQTILCATVLLVHSITAAAQKPSADIDTDHVISEFTTGETEFQAALNRYGYKCEVIIQTIKGGQVTGEFHRTSQISLDKDGNPEERILSLPTPSLRDAAVTSQDLEDISAKAQFTLDAANAPKYKFTYVGNERIENVDLYVFDVRPKAVPPGERFFSGRVWVTVNDLRIAKMRGKAVRKTNQKFPTIEMYRSAVEGRYLFPSYAFADEELSFDNGARVHVRIAVRYTDYVKLK